MLALAGCQAEPQEELARDEFTNSENPTPPSMAKTALTKSPATEAYTKAKKCLLDVAMRTMSNNPSGGPSSVNTEMFDMFKEQMIATGARLEKSEAEVMNEFQQLVAGESARVSSMSQSGQEQYILTTNAHAIECMKRKRQDLVP